MSESYQTKSDVTGGNIEPSGSRPAGEAGRTMLIGVLGGVLSAAGYVIFQRLPDDQKVRLQRQARTLLESRITEIRSNFNI